MSAALSLMFSMLNTPTPTEGIASEYPPVTPLGVTSTLGGSEKPSVGMSFRSSLRKLRSPRNCRPSPSMFGGDVEFLAGGRVEGQRD